MTSQPDLLRLVETPQRTAFVRLMESAPRSREEHVNKMLAAPPWPSNKPDAQARVSAMVAILTGDSGYRVGDLHPSTEAG